MYLNLFIKLANTKLSHFSNARECTIFLIKILASKSKTQERGGMSLLDFSLLRERQRCMLGSRSLISSTMQLGPNFISFPQLPRLRNKSSDIILSMHAISLDIRQPFMLKMLLPQISFLALFHRLLVYELPPSLVCLYRCHRDCPSTSTTTERVPAVYSLFQQRFSFCSKVTGRKAKNLLPTVSHYHDVK